MVNRGCVCDMLAIMEIAARHNRVVLEEVAHAAGSKYEGKDRTVGEGGILVTNDDTAAEKTRRLRSHGMTTLTWDRHQGHAFRHDGIDIGYNYRIDEIRSALGIEQLHKLPSGNQRRLHECFPEVCVPFDTYRGISAYANGGCAFLPVTENITSSFSSPFWLNDLLIEFEASRISSWN
jgi:hypothetical protein